MAVITNSYQNGVPWPPETRQVIDAYIAAIAQRNEARAALAAARSAETRADRQATVDALDVEVSRLSMATHEATLHAIETDPEVGRVWLWAQWAYEGPILDEQYERAERAQFEAEVKRAEADRAARHHLR
jgi:hypothetical protein